MELGVWLLVTLTIFIATSVLLFTKRKNRLPPGPVAVPLLGNLLWLRNSASLLDIELLLQNLHRKYGPIVTLRMSSLTAIFISDRSIAHKVLVEHGAAFSNRPTLRPETKFFNNNQHHIVGANGPLWRLLRRNITTEILHPSRIKLYAHGRHWVLGVLTGHLYAQSQSSDDGSVVAKDNFHFAMFCLLVLMCFGEKLDEKAIREMETAQNCLFLYARKLNVLQFFPPVTKYIYRNRLRTALGMRKKQTEILLPLIKARRESWKKQLDNKERFVYSYLDSLLDIKLPEGGRSLSEEEMIGLCSEFLNAGTDTTTTAMQWIMAELVKNPEIQKKLFEEIESLTGGDMVKEEELHKMPYLKAVVLEGLRRHPPSHFVVPHAAGREVEIEGYIIPKNASVNFMVAEMGCDGMVWEEPMEFKPERFLNGGEGEGVDITGSREIKMMPFGVGRRICPALGLATLHLEYFVGNLVREFEWKEVEGHEVDLSEKTEFSVVMKHSLRARLVPRAK